MKLEREKKKKIYIYIYIYECNVLREDVKHYKSPSR